MSCMVLVGGCIGCGKTTFINYLVQNESDLLGSFNEDGSDISIYTDIKTNGWKAKCSFFTIHFDDMCSIKEQEQMMKTLKGWRDFRVDLLMAAERLISYSCESENSTSGPLTERSHGLLEILISMTNKLKNNLSNAIILIEDNFYYRSMRYDWFQIARRNNLGFATIFLHCPLSTAVFRNSLRGYQIPESKIKKMLSILEFPDPVKYRWEKYSLNFDSTPELNNSCVMEVVNLIKEAAKHPAEVVISEQKIEAQKICSKNVVHQSDKILRRILSKKISEFKGATYDEENLKPIVAHLVNTRQKMLLDIKHGDIDLPQDLVDKIQNLGIESVLDTYEETLEILFNLTLAEKSLEKCVGNSL